MPRRYPTNMIRLATKDDLDELVELDAALFPDNCFNERTLSIEMRLGVCWVFDQLGIQAYMLTRPADEMLDIVRLGVRPAWQGAGLGRLLLEEAVKTGLVLVLSVKIDNTKAIQLYRKMGFVEVGWFPYAGALVLKRPHMPVD